MRSVCLEEPIVETLAGSKAAEDDTIFLNLFAPGRRHGWSSLRRVVRFAAHHIKGTIAFGVITNQDLTKAWPDGLDVLGKSSP